MTAKPSLNLPIQETYLKGNCRDNGLKIVINDLREMSNEKHRF